MPDPTFKRPSSSAEIRVADVMTRDLYTLHPAQSLPLAEALMGLTRIRHVPVVNDDRQLVGLVTHRDLLAAKISMLIPLTADERSTLELSIPVSKIMRTEVWTITPDALAVSAASIMRDHRFGCLPVVSGDTTKAPPKELVGIICESDLLSLVIDAIDLDHPRRMTVAGAMTKAPITITSETSIQEARELMRRHQIRHLPVLGEDQRAVAIVSDRELRVAELIYRNTDRTVVPASHAARLIGSEAIHRAHPDDSVEGAFRTMSEQHIDSMVVEEEGGRLVGILTAIDACRFVGRRRQ